MLFKEKIFREYDIRGEAGVDFDEEFAFALGAVLARRIGAGKTMGVGFDCRSSSPGLRDHFCAGAMKAGCQVFDCGMGPTPQLYHSVVTQGFDGGVQITASHNPGPDNGFKMMVGKSTLSGDKIRTLKAEVEDFIRSGDFESFFQDFDAGTKCEEFAARENYLKDLIEKSKDRVNSARKLKVVVDGGNGVGGLVGPDLLRELGCEVVELYCEPDGTFPNHHPDPTVVENLKDLAKLVKKEKADFGIAWDGDADRIGVVDEKGTPVFGDMLLTIYGRALLAEVDKPIIIGDVKCSDVMFQDLSSKGAETVMSKTGHSLIKAKLKELSAHLAGEMSGHMFFAHRYYGFDDALHAAARLVEIHSNQEGLFSDLLSDLPKVYSTPEIRLDCPEELKFKMVAHAIEAFPEYQVDTTDGARIRFENGWGLVRASNTGAVLVMRFEAKSEEELANYQELVTSRLDKIRIELSN